MINSRLGLFTATLFSSRSKSGHQGGHSFFRSYGVIMPSSLTMVLSIALVCSTCLPVSVLVRAPNILPRSFSRKHGITDFSTIASSSRLSLKPCGFTYMEAYLLSRGHPEPRPAILLRHSIGQTNVSGTGMSACCASTTPRGLALAPD